MICCENIVNVIEVTELIDIFQQKKTHKKKKPFIFS